MKFLLGTGEQFKEKVRFFPKYYAWVFSSAPILVVVMNNGEVAGACCITRLSNSVIMIINKKYRGRGLGTILEWTTICQARKQGRSFVTGALSLRNVPALRIVHKLGYKEITRIKGYEYILMMIPFHLRGKALYVFSRQFLHVLSFLLPEIFYAILIKFVMDATEWAHR